MAGFNHQEEMIVEHCCECGITFAFTRDFYDEKRKDEGLFYCPNGHPQHYTESELKRLQKKVKSLEEDRKWWIDEAVRRDKKFEHQRRRAAAYKAHFTRIKKKDLVMELNHED